MDRRLYLFVHIRKYSVYSSAYLGFEPIRLTLLVLQPPFYKDNRQSI